MFLQRNCYGKFFWYRFKYSINSNIIKNVTSKYVECSRPSNPLHPATATPQALQAPQAPQAPQGQQLVHLNWSHFKTDFSRKLDEDVEAHLLRTNDWVNAHHFIEDVKVQRFCLTLLEEA